MERLHSESPHARVTVEIFHDPDPLNPRTEYDGHLGVMACWHRRYTLGDAQPSKSPAGYRGDLAGEAIGRHKFEARIERMGRRAEKTGDWDRFTAESDAFIESVLAAHYVMLPLYLYDHGGITMSTGGFSCPWDSGQVGFIYCLKADAAKEYGHKRFNQHTEKLAIARLKSEVAEYDLYLTGQCYGFKVKIDGKTDESCWGFLGDMNDCLEEARAYGKDAVDHVLTESAREWEESRPDMYGAPA